MVKRKLTIHNVFKEMHLDCNGGSNNDVEIIYYDKDSCEMKKVRSTVVAIKMNRNEERDIELEWE